MTAPLLDRLEQLIIRHQTYDARHLAELIIKEIEARHVILDPDTVTEEMLDACFTALPKHYDPPDMTRRPWHALKARQRFTAMARAAPRVTPK